jgi:hypothetical protein
MSKRRPQDETLTLPPVAPLIETQLSIPRDVALVIQREAEANLCDPFMARRLAAHYRQGIWTPADANSK